MSEKDIAFYATKIDQLHQRMKFVEDNSIAGLRDFFATSALSILSNSSFNWTKVNPIFTKAPLEKEVAEYCYAIADAMMKEREKK